MPKKCKRKTIKERRAAVKNRQERLRLNKLEREGRLANGVEMPAGAIAADLSEQAPSNSCSPTLFYRDIEFKCADCGTDEVWTAKNQKWYFEVLKRPIYGGPKRCAACRKKFRAMKLDQQRRMAESERRKKESQQ
jgi:hypothetical protein